MENFIVISAFLSFIIFIFPIFATVSVIIGGKRIGFSIYLFSVIKLGGGYITFHKEGYCVHISKNKAIFVPYKNMSEERKKFAVTEGFQLYKLHLTAELNKNADHSIPLAVIMQSGLQSAFALIKAERKYLSLKSGVLLSEGEPSLTLKTVTVFNVFVLARAVIKIIMGRIITKIWQKKQKIRS